MVDVTAPAHRHHPKGDTVMLTVLTVVLVAIMLFVHLAG